MADKSGLDWFKKHQSKFPNSEKISDLSGSFKTAAQCFVDALEAAGGKVKVSSTLRDATRAFIMHYAWLLAKGQIKAADIPKRSGLDIEWDHGNEADSRKAAQDMIGPQGFGMEHIAALNSVHIKGLAIDMTISWSGDLQIKDAKGKEVVIKSNPRSGQNKELHAVGKTYGVIKLVKDKPHWSHDGS